MTALRQLRHSRHLTQAQLAALITVERSTYVRLELGQRRIDLAILSKIAHVLALSDHEIADLVRSTAQAGDDPYPTNAPALGVAA